MWSSISRASSGDSISARVTRGRELAFLLGRLVIGGLVLERLRSALWFVRVCVVSPVAGMKCCQEGWMSVEAGVVSLDSFLCSVEAGRGKVARRVSMEVRIVDSGPNLFPFGSLANMTLVAWM